MSQTLFRLTRVLLGGLLAIGGSLGGMSEPLVASDSAATAKTLSPVPLILDTDMGNDVDDALALAMIHSLQSRGECQLLAVTLTKDHPLAASYIDAINTFYGRGDIPIGACRSGVTPDPGKFLPLAARKDGDARRYPHDLVDGNDAPDAVAILRKTLAEAADRSVVIVQVGFSTNLARLLDSPADEISPLPGDKLVEQKVRLVSVMAGSFAPIEGKTDFGEYNVVTDLPSAHALANGWPTPIVWSGYEIGLALPYPHGSILRDYRYVPHHPVAESYHLYSPPPHDRPTWDLTSVLYAVRPDQGYFRLSAPGRVSFSEKGVARFEEAEGGRDRYLILDTAQRPRVLEALTLLSSQPPSLANSKPK